MPFTIFGFTIARNKEEKFNKSAAIDVPFDRSVSDVRVIAPDNFQPTGAGHESYMASIPTTAFFSSEEYAHAIKRWRSMAKTPEVNFAIDQIVHSMINIEAGGNLVSLNLDNVEILNDTSKEIISKEFREILNLIEFRTKAYEYLRDWYIDGWIYFQIILNKDNPEDGIIDLIRLDASRMRKTRVVLEEQHTHQAPVKIRDIVYHYYYRNSNNEIWVIPEDTIAAVDSGEYVQRGDYAEQFSISDLDIAYRALNQLQIVEDCIVVYRLRNAPERLVFYIDTGDLPASKVENYINRLKNEIKNHVEYDFVTGQLNTQKRNLSVVENFYVPRTAQHKSEITTLPGGQNLGELQDVEYLREKLYLALKLPKTRAQKESRYTLGRSADIFRDEMQFAKFIQRKRIKFNELFIHLLGLQLMLKKLILPEEWYEIEHSIDFKWEINEYFNELTFLEIMNERIAILERTNQFRGDYFSKKYIQKKFLNMSDEDIITNQEQIEKEGGDTQGKGSGAQGFSSSFMPSSGGGFGGGMETTPSPDINQSPGLPDFAGGTGGGTNFGAPGGSPDMTGEEFGFGNEEMGMESPEMTGQEAMPEMGAGELDFGGTPNETVPQAPNQEENEIEMIGSPRAPQRRFSRRELTPPTDIGEF